MACDGESVAGHVSLSVFKNLAYPLNSQVLSKSVCVTLLFFSHRCLYWALNLVLLEVIFFLPPLIQFLGLYGNKDNTEDGSKCLEFQNLGTGRDGEELVLYRASSPL